MAAGSEGSVSSEDCKDHRCQWDVWNPLSGVSPAQNGTQFCTQSPKSVLQIIYQKEPKQNFSLPDGVKCRITE